VKSEDAVKMARELAVKEGLLVSDVILKNIQNLELHPDVAIVEFSSEPAWLCCAYLQLQLFP